MQDARVKLVQFLTNQTDCWKAQWLADETTESDQTMVSTSTNPPAATFDFECQRNGQPDRRINKARTALTALYRYRRRGPRRESETVINSYVDVHDSKVIWLAFGTCLLSVTDACFTWFLIHFGDSYELNPFMDAALQHSFELFLLAKLVITVTCVVTLVLHKHHLLFNRISGYQILLGTFFVYLLLISYELSMLRHLPLF